MDGMLATMGLGLEEGWFNFPEQTLNELCPQVKPISVADFLNTYLKN
jgi:hypothetical protein